MRVLFMCTANSCRSILSEAVFNHLAPDGFEAVSAGSFPKGQVLPRSLATLQQAGISTQGLSSKGNEAFEGCPPDIVVTVCDKAAGEACPVYFGTALKAHWGRYRGRCSDRRRGFPRHVGADNSPLRSILRPALRHAAKRSAPASAGSHRYALSITGRRSPLQA